MQVISDADVIIHLSNLKSLSLLQLIYTEIAIPEYVKSEISKKDDGDIQRALVSFIKVLSTSIKGKNRTQMPQIEQIYADNVLGAVYFLFLTALYVAPKSVLIRIISVIRVPFPYSFAFFSVFRGRNKETDK